MARAGQRVVSPKRYAPLADPSPPRRWNDEAILRALKQWAEEMGRPPRRQESCGEQPHVAPPGQRKWIREHPYWPSSSCVAGVDRPQLSACRLPAPMRRAGREPARGTLHRLHHARADDPARMDRDTVREAIRAWTARHGSPRAITSGRITLIPRRMGTESPRWPSAAVVCDLYDEYRNPWNAALVAAGSSLRSRVGVTTRSGRRLPTSGRAPAARRATQIRRDRMARPDRRDPATPLRQCESRVGRPSARSPALGRRPGGTGHAVHSMATRPAVFEAGQHRGAQPASNQGR